MAVDDTSVRISREEKQTLEDARSIWERKVGRRITAGEFIRILAERYIQEMSTRSQKEKKSKGLIAVQEARPATAQAVRPGPQVSLVTCIRCHGQIGWRTDLSREGYCPYCGMYLRLIGK